MLFEKTRVQQPLSAAPARTQPVDELRQDLGVIGSLKVNNAERRAKSEAAKHLVRRTVAIATDIAETQLEIDATIMKSGLMGRAVPIMGCLLDEVVMRTGHVRLGLQATEHANIVAQIKSRHQTQDDYQHLFATGQMTEAELAEANAFTAQRTTQNCMRTIRDIDRAHEGLDAHLARVVDHVKNISKEGK